jgi:hypothetical protein
LHFLKQKIKIVPMGKDNELRRDSVAVFRCKFTESGKCIYKGKEVPSKQWEFVGKKFCEQGSSSYPAKIDCSTAEVVKDEVLAYVTKSGMMS